MNRLKETRETSVCETSNRNSDVSDNTNLQLTTEKSKYHAFLMIKLNEDV